MTPAPAATSVSAAAIASNVAVSSNTTAVDPTVARPPKPRTSQTVQTCGRLGPRHGDRWGRQLEPVPAGRRAGGDDHLVRCGVEHEIGIDRRAQVDVHAEAGDLVGQQPGDRARGRRGAVPRPPFVPVRRGGSAHLVEVHLVAAQCCRAGGLHARRSRRRRRAPSCAPRPAPGVSNATVASLPAAMLTTHCRRPVVISWATQPMLVPMHGRISSSRPARALATRCGSAIIARTIETMSATPRPDRWLGVVEGHDPAGDDGGHADGLGDLLAGLDLVAERVVERGQELVEPPVRAHRDVEEVDRAARCVRAIAAASTGSMPPSMKSVPDNAHADGKARADLAADRLRGSRRGTGCGSRWSRRTRHRAGWLPATGTGR